MNTSPLHLGAIGLAIVLTGLGQVLVKQASTRSRSTVGIFFDPRLVAGYAMLLGVTLLVGFALREIPMRELSAWQTLTYPATIGLSVLMLRERLGRREAWGLALLVLGLAIFVTAEAPG